MILAKEVKETEYHPFYHTYIKLTEGDLIQHLELGLEEISTVINKIPEDKIHFAYDAGKWTVAQLIQHCIDVERVFQYRLFCISRGEKQMLNGFDENAYADALPSEQITSANLIHEFITLRHSTITLLKSLPIESLGLVGQASGNPLSARAAAFIILGHWNHHLNILKTRYLNW